MVQFCSCLAIEVDRMPPRDGVRGGGDGDATDKEWLFDFFMSVFRSPQWDASVMGFIDEHCAVFDTDEENKLAYTEMHKQFKDLVSRCYTSCRCKLQFLAGYCFRKS